MGRTTATRRWYLQEDNESRRPHSITSSARASSEAEIVWRLGGTDRLRRRQLARRCALIAVECEKIEGSGRRASNSAAALLSRAPILLLSWTARKGILIVGYSWGKKWRDEAMIQN